MTTVDRVSGSRSDPVPGWTGRWMRGGVPVLDATPRDAAASRDTTTSEDLDALATLTQALDYAIEDGTWRALLACPLLAVRDDTDLQLHEREATLEVNLPSIAQVCERFITRLGERTELLPVARVKRPARRAIERLAGHTEDWAGRDLSGPIPRRAMAVTREEDVDLYENRMVVELVHPILSTALSDRIRRVRRLRSDLAELERAKHEGTFMRRDRLYKFWGAGYESAARSTGRAGHTLQALEDLAARVNNLRGSTLVSFLRGRRTGYRTLRRTNVVENEKHYRSAGIVWAAYEREPEIEETNEERQQRLVDVHMRFDRYVLGLLCRSLRQLRCEADVATLPTHGREVSITMPWGPASLRRDLGGVVSIDAAGISTRFVPLVDLVAPSDDPAAIAERWESIRAAAPPRTVIVYLAPVETMLRLPPALAAAMVSSGQDGVDGRANVVGIPVSPLETPSLERVARAVTQAVLEPALHSYPPPIRAASGRLPRRVIDSLTQASISQPGASPLFHRPSADVLCLRRPPMPNESARLELTLRALADRTKSPGWERDIAAVIRELPDVLAAAIDNVERFLVCPGCSKRAPAGSFVRQDDTFALTCSSCETRWGLERCGQCGGRVAFIAPERDLLNPDVTGPGWVERILGQDAIASPCWARRVSGRFICSECGSCPVSGTASGAECDRCGHAPATGTS